MQIHGLSRLDAPHAVGGPHSARGPVSAKGPHDARPTVDQLDLSPAALAASRLAEAPEIRTDLVAQLKAQIADGSYDSPERLDLALDRLLDEIGG